jgi:hypothetical protein
MSECSIEGGHFMEKCCCDFSGFIQQAQLTLANSKILQERSMLARWL